MLARSRQGTFATVLGRTPEASLVADRAHVGA
jgi:hypothetical protein